MYGAQPPRGARHGDLRRRRAACNAPAPRPLGRARRLPDPTAAARYLPAARGQKGDDPRQGNLRRHDFSGKRLRPQPQNVGFAGGDRHKQRRAAPRARPSGDGGRRPFLNRRPMDPPETAFFTHGSLSTVACAVGVSRSGAAVPPGQASRGAHRVRAPMPFCWRRAVDHLEHVQYSPMVCSPARRLTQTTGTACW